MEWLELMELWDGTRVESSIPTGDGPYSPSGPWYRVNQADGTTCDFTTMSSMLVYLHDQWGM